MAEHNMLIRNSLRVLASLLLLTCAVLTGVAQAQLPPTQTANGIEYVTGGFGQEESNAFKQARTDYALALTFAVNASGSASSPYAGNVQVQLRSTQGDTVLDAVSTGPYFLANPDPGRYTLVVSFQGDTQTKEITLMQGKATELKFTWDRPSSGPD